jgi:hypothetical protein
MDDFIAKAVPDPKNSGGTQLVSGFIGASPEPEHTRIYWDASLSTYVDVKTADIFHSEPLPKEQSPLGGSYIWLKRDGQVSFGSAAGQSQKGKFFEGAAHGCVWRSIRSGGRSGDDADGGRRTVAVQQSDVVPAECPLSLCEPPLQLP